MQYFKRFFREHMRPYVPSLVLGTFLLQLAGMGQALFIGALKYVFEDSFKMGGSQAAAVSKTVSTTFSFFSLEHLKVWLQGFLPQASTLRQTKFLLPLLLVLIYLFRGLFNYFGTLLMVRGGVKATQSLQERLFRRILGQEPAFFHQHPVGELMQRCLGDVGQVQGIASNQLADMIREVTMAIAMFTLAMKMHWDLTLILLVAVPLVVLPIRQINLRTRRHSHRNMEVNSAIMQRLKEVFSNIRVVMGFAREEFELERLRGLQKNIYRMTIRVAKMIAISTPIMEFVGALFIAGLILWVSDRIHSGALNGTEFLTYILALYAFYDPIRRLTRLNTDFQLAQATLGRVYTMMDRLPSIQGPETPTAVPLNPQAIYFEQVYFAYEPDRPVLQGIDLVVKRGETVALVGGSGGGKTTLVNLVPRFFDPTGGRITLDGMDLRDFDPRELRQRIGIVTQETLLFMDSVHDNIAYGKEASREAVIEAAKKAHAHTFIEQLPQGYDTPLVETGASVSGGQRQRLAIARALLQDPPILILDEATSALDTESERAVQAALEVLMQNRTTLVIAHRLSTIQRANVICVLKEGKIVEQGSHQALLALNREYAHLHRLQFGDNA